MQSTDPLSSSRYLVEHAKRRLQEFETESRAFFGSDPCSLVVEPNDDATQDLHKVKLVKPMPVSLPGIAFDIIGGLRAALDQAGYAVAAAHGNVSQKTAKFPFGDTEAEVRSRSGYVSKDIPPEVFEVMVALKPYKGGNDTLWALNKLCNANKHAILVPVVTASPGFRFDHAVIDLSGGGGIGYRWDPVKNEMVFLSAAPGSKQHYDLKFAIDIKFGEVEGAAGRPALAFMGDMAREVERSLVAIEGEARRIGLFS